MNKLNAFVATKNTVYQRAVIQFATVTGQYEMACRRQFENAAARLHLPTFSSQKATINNLSHRLLLAAKRRYLIAEQDTTRHQQTLTALDPQRTLERGYSIVRDANTRIVSDGKKLRPYDSLNIVFAHGNAQVTVKTASDGEMAKSPSHKPVQ